MSLTINRQQAMATNSPFAHGLGSAENVGKLNIASSVQEPFTTKETNNNVVDLVTIDDIKNPEALRALNYSSEAYVDGRMYGDLKPEWFMATKIASIMAQANPEQDSGNLMAAITNIVNGNVKYEPTDKMLEATDLYVQYLEDKNRAWAAINEFRGNHKDAFNTQVTLSKLSEDELAEYGALNDNLSKLVEIYNQKSNELFAEILADMKKV